MHHYSKYSKPDRIFPEFVVPFLLQFVMLAVCMCADALLIGRGGLVQAPALVGDEMTEPTLGRLLAVIIFFVLFLLCGIVASRSARKGKEILPFWLGIFGGTFLWISIGENLWHFAVGGVNFTTWESIASLPIAVMLGIFVIYAAKHRSLDWGIWCLLFSFISNWMGHFVMLGTYPIFESIFEPRTWNLISAFASGAILLVLGLLMGLKYAADRKGRMFASMVAYIAIGIISLGIMEG